MRAEPIGRTIRSRFMECVGAVAQLANITISAGEQVIAPRTILNPTMFGADFFVLQGTDARHGAALIDKLVKRSPYQEVNYDILRTHRPLLAETQIYIKDPLHESIRLDISANASGADWSAQSKRAGNLAIYIDDKYHSDLLILSERDDIYKVNLAGLSAGKHNVELRWSKDLVKGDASKPFIESVSAKTLTADEALIARFSPIIETRTTRMSNGVAPATLTTDIPLLIAPTVENYPDGSKRIMYDLLLSNEDGGVDARHAFRELGRTIDQELVYRVDLDSNGNRVKDMFQGPLHVPYAYQGQRFGERPLLTVATRNNLFTSRAISTAPRWSEAPLVAADKRRSDRSLLIQNPWTSAVMSKELIHEGKINPTRKFFPVYDPRRYLFVDRDDEVRRALIDTGTIHLKLKDGSVLPFSPSTRRHTIPFPWAPPLGTAVPLPETINSDAILGVLELSGSKESTTFVLNDAYRARSLLSVKVDPKAEHPEFLQNSEGQRVSLKV